jgi:small subunit ribosomal protein S7
MSRRRTQKKRTVMPDPVYDSRLVELLVGQLMREGKKLLAYRICYESLNQVAQATQQEPLGVLEQAIRNASPLVEVKARRIGGSTYQVPLEVAPERGTALALRWILSACRKKSGRPMASKLTSELLDAAKNTGLAVRKKEEVHKMAEANKAFAKYRF